MGGKTRSRVSSQHYLVNWAIRPGWIIFKSFVKWMAISFWPLRMPVGSNLVSQSARPPVSVGNINNLPVKPGGLVRGVGRPCAPINNLVDEPTKHLSFYLLVVLLIYLQSWLILQVINTACKPPAHFFTRNLQATYTLIRWRVNIVYWALLW